MLSKKTESAKNFLKSLEDPGITVNLMNDRMDTEILQVISNYSDLIFKIKDKTKVPDKDILSCAMILGYLLKSHVDRYEISESLNDIN